MSLPDNCGARIRCNPDGSRAVLDILYPVGVSGQPIALEDVQEALARLGVVAGIDWPVLERTVEQTRRSGLPVRNIVAARATSGGQAHAHLAGEIQACERARFQNFLRGARWTGEAFSRRDFASPEGEPLFVKAAAPVMIVEPPELAIDVFGRVLPSAAREMTDFFAGPGVIETNTESGREFVAEVAGYVALNRHGLLTVISPLLPSEDRLRLDFVILPIQTGAAELGDFLRAVLSETDPEMLSPEERAEASEFCQERLLAGESACRLIRHGRPPVPGTPGKINWRVNLTTKPDAQQTEERINYAELSPFHEIAAGEVIAVAKIPTPGQPGVDVFGSPLPPPLAEEERLEIGENILEETSGDIVVYKAGLSGTVRLEGHRLSVSESLIIRGNVDSVSGNLHHAKDIAVEGDVRAGFTVECGGNLTVGGSIENGATVKCGGRLEVCKGIFGRKTLVQAKRDANVGFIQESHVEVGGDLKVDDYVQDSIVFCRGRLIVEGHSVRGNRHGAVMGGQTAALAGMELHSAGTPLAQTFLTCGVDERLILKIREGEKYLALLAKRMVRLQTALGFDPSSPNATTYLARLSPQARQSIKNVLAELRQTAEQRETLNQRLESLRKIAVAPNLNELTIAIQRHLTPTVIIRIGDTRHAIAKEAQNATYQLHPDGRIVRAGHN